MKGPYRRIYPGEGAILFDGGLSNKFERSIIEDNESPDCLNVIFTAGAVETRQGTTKLNTTSVGYGAFDGIYTRRGSDNSETMVVFAGGHMLALASTTFVTVPSAQSLFTAGVRVAQAQYQNYMFIGNGFVIPHKYNGTTFTRHGVYPPTTTAAVASNGVGALTASGQYQYKVTYVNSALVESDLGPVSSTFVISSTSGQNTVSAIPVAPTSFGVNSRYLYRNANASATFKRVTQILDNTTTTFNDNVADTALGSTAPTDQGLPPLYSALIYHQNRIFCNDPANPNFVWYSDINSGGPAPYSFPSTNFFRVGDNATDLVKGFGVYQNSVMVYCERSIWLNYMPDATTSNWKQIRIESPYGTKSPFCVIDYNDKQMYAAVQNDKFVGFAAIKGLANDQTSSVLSVLSAGSDRKSDRIEPDMFQVQESYLSNISAIVFKNRAYLTMTYGTAQTTNNRLYVYDFSISNLKKDQEASWVPWTGLNVSQFTIYSGNLYYASSDTTGYIFKMEAGVYSDNGAAINSYFWTKEFPGFENEINFSKDFRYSNLLLESSGAWFMDFGYRVDSDSGSGLSRQIDLTPGGSLWGSMVFGRDKWGGGSAQFETRQFLDGSRGKRIQFKFSNQNVAGQKFKVMRQGFTYNLKGYR